MRWSRRILAVCCFIGAAAKGAETAPALEPAPEQAFVGESAPPAAPQASTQEAAPVDSAETPPASLELPGASGVFDQDTLDAIFNSSDGTFEEFIHRLLGMVGSGDPGTRDKLKLILGSSVGYDTNVAYSATDKIKSATASATGALDYKFGSQRLQLDARLGGGVTYYQRRPGSRQDQNYQLNLALDYKWSPRLSVSAHTNTAYLSQPDPQIIGGIQQYTGSYWFTDTGFNLEFALRPRLSLTAGMTINAIRYENEAINNGSGFVQENFSLGANFLISPITTFITQYRYNPIEYYESGESSDGHFLLIGIQQSLSRRLDYQLLGGLEYRKLTTTIPGGPTSYTGPYLEGEITYKAGPATNISATLRYGTEPSGNTIRETFRGGVSAYRKFGSRLEMTLNIFYERDHYDQPSSSTDFTQTYYTTGLDVVYRLTLATAFRAHGDYQIATSSFPNSDYTRGYVSFGLEFTF